MRAEQGPPGGEGCLGTNRTGLPRDIEVEKVKRGLERRDLLVEAEKTKAAALEDESLLSNSTPL